MERKNFMLSNEIFARLKAYCDRKDIPMSGVVRQALEEYLDRKEHGIRLREEKTLYHVEKEDTPQKSYP